MLIGLPVMFFYTGRRQWRAAVARLQRQIAWLTARLSYSNRQFQQRPYNYVVNSCCGARQTLPLYPAGPLLTAATTGNMELNVW